MFLYELAIELDARSTDLVDLAERLGLGELGPTETVTPHQAQQLRAAHGGAAIAPLEGAEVSRTMPPMEGARPHGRSRINEPTSFAAAPDPEPRRRSRRRPGNAEAEGRRHAIAIGVVALAAAALFVYMVRNGGPDAAKERELAADQASDERAADTAIATTDPGGVVASVETFCGAADGRAAWEARVDTAAQAADWADVQRIAAEERSTWEQAMDDLVAAGPPDLVQPLETYRSAYGLVWDGLAASTSQADQATRVAAVDPVDLRSAAAAVTPAIRTLCGPG